MQNSWLAFRWYLSLAKKLFSVVPINLSLAVFWSVISQFLLILSSVLPIKVILLLGSDTAPAWLASIFNGVSLESLVIVFSVSAAVSFILHNVVRHLEESQTAIGATLTVIKSKKMWHHSSQEQLATAGFRAVEQSTASVVFCSIFGGAIFLVYPAVAVLLCLYLVFYFVAALGLVRYRRLDSIDLLLQVFAGLGVLLCFSFIVFDVLYGGQSNLLFAIVCLILVRQALSKIALFVRNLDHLYMRRFSYGDLFFHQSSSSLFSESVAVKDDVWGLITEADFEDYLGSILQRSVKAFSGCSISSFYVVDTANPNILALAVNLVSKDGEEERCLVKLFSSRYSHLAANQVLLLESYSRLPCLELLAVSKVKQYDIHVFRFKGVESITNKDFEHANFEIAFTMASVSPSSKLLDLSDRSLESSIHKIREINIDLLFAALPVKFLAWRSDLVDILDKVTAIADSLPKTVFVPAIRKGIIWRNENGEYVISDWSNWSLEVVGCGWSGKKGSYQQFCQLYSRVASVRKDVSNLDMDMLYLFDRVWDLERKFAKKNLQECHTIMEQIKPFLDRSSSFEVLERI